MLREGKYKPRVGTYTRLSNSLGEGREIREVLQDLKTEKPTMSKKKKVEKEENSIYHFQGSKRTWHI